jgi:hypothetical protein
MSLNGFRKGDSGEYTVTESSSVFEDEDIGKVSGKK